ncbi:hypothetical protein LPJ71_011042 [Coemansia sp. S17]|nr:hypothetical protein LPJ71_011042 [Coemansia sp. S17]
MVRKSRRRSVVGVAPASLQRIADEAQTIREECEQLLILMSPLYRESQLSPRVHTMTLASSPPPLPGPTPPLTTERVAVSAVGIAVDDTPTAPSVSLEIDAPTAVSDAKP